MQSLSKNDLTDLLRFVEQQIVFTIESTRNVSHYNNFLTSMEATILFNSKFNMHVPTNHRRNHQAN